MYLLYEHLTVLMVDTLWVRQLYLYTRQKIESLKENFSFIIGQWTFIFKVTIGIAMVPTVRPGQNSRWVTSGMKLLAHEC